MMDKNDVADIKCDEVENTKENEKIQNCVVFETENEPTYLSCYCFYSIIP